MLSTVRKGGDLFCFKVCKLRDHVREAYCRILEVWLVQVDQCVNFIDDLFTDLRGLKNLGKGIEFVVNSTGIGVVVENGAV